jgi:nitric oxide reductase subunit B
VRILSLAVAAGQGAMPAGVYQARASISEGVWFARSPAFVHSSLMETFVWLRVPGGIVFALGTLFLAIFAGRLLIVRRNPAAVASANAFADKTM